jgi:hypothetical protein
MTVLISPVLEACLVTARSASLLATRIGTRPVIVTGALMSL